MKRGFESSLLGREMSMELILALQPDLATTNRASEREEMTFEDTSCHIGLFSYICSLDSRFCFFPLLFLQYGLCLCIVPLYMLVWAV